MSETAAAIPAPKRSKKSLVIAAAAVVILVGSAGGAAFWWSQRAEAKAQTPETAAAITDTAERGMVSFEPFVVNLADTAASRFLRIKVQLIVGDVAQAAAIQESPVKLSRARSAILELLTTQTSDVLVTPKGKAALRAAISESLGRSLKMDVVDVLFSDFVVQF